MATTKVSSRLQTPADSSGTRKDVHLINTTDEVIVDYEDASASRILGTKLQEMRPVISRSQPSASTFRSSFVWCRIVDTTPSLDTINNNLNNSTGTGVNTDLSKK